MKQNKILIGAVAVLAVLLLAELIFLAVGMHREPEESFPTEPVMQNTQAATEPAAVTTKPARPTETTTAPTTAPTQTTVPSAPPATVETRAPIVVPPQPKPTEYHGLTFPIDLPEYGLKIRMIRGYDGIFLEDGSDVPISGVAAILVENYGGKNVDLARISMMGPRTTYEFSVSGLPAGASAIVMEAGKAPFAEQRYDAVSADVAQTDHFELTAALKVEETEDGKLRIENVSGQDIPCARVFYKFYLAEENTYVGGITYTAKILDLKAGASVEIQPSHYAAGSSKVIMAKIYESDTE